MCVVSNVGDYYGRRWPEQYPWVPEVPYTPQPGTGDKIIVNPPEVSRKEFEALKKDVEEALRLLKNAKEIDRVTGQPDCEMDEKVAIIKRFAEVVGVDLSEVFGNKD